MRVQAAVALLAGAAAACPYAALLPPDVSSVVVACPANATLCTVDRACGAIAPCSPLPGVLDLRCSGSPALGDLSATNVSDLSVMCTKLNLEALVLPALASFTVQNCSIERMPSALQWPTSLLTMDLANTSLQSVPAGLPHRLRDLRLDDNDLSRSTASLDSLPTSLRRLSLQACHLRELRNLDWRHLQFLHLGHNPQLRTLANVSLHASHLVAFSCDGCNLSSVMLDASSYQALNALSPSTDAKGFAVDNSTAIEASVAECDRHHAARKPLWAAHGHKFFVCVLPQIDVQYTNLWSTIGVAVTSSAFLALVVVGGCLLRRDRRARRAKQLEVLNDLTLADLAMVQLDETALLLEARVAGRVWRGRYKGSVVAIKKLHVPTPAETQRFVHAIHVLTTLDGPSIVPFLGAAWTSPTDLKCVLEFMPHGDLRSYLATTPEAAVPWSRKAQFLRDILNGLVYLHDAVPMLHGCLDARHVLLDADCRAYLYGMTATVLGTDSSDANRWVAPEVRHGEPLSTAADIYALGLLVAELSTHTVPVQQIEGHENDGSSELPVFASSCPAWVRDLALSCLATDPAHRPTALDLVSTLQSHSSDCAI